MTSKQSLGWLAAFKLKHFKAIIVNSNPNQKTICLITQLHPSMNPRLVKEADALSEVGYKVIVIAPQFSEWATKADEEYKDRAWRIVERPRYGPLSSGLERFRELARRSIADFATRKLRIRSHWFVGAAWHPATPLLVRAALRHKADLYVAHLVSALPAAAIAARRYKAMYAFDAEDFHLGELDNCPSNVGKRHLVKSIESSFISGCTYVTAASPLIAGAYRDTYKICTPTVVLNVFPIEYAFGNCLPAKQSSTEKSVYWYSNVIGPNRGLECAVRAIGLSSSNPHLYLRGEAILDFCKKLESIAWEAGVSDRLHFLPLGAPSEMVRLAAEYDVGFVGETGGTLNRQLCLTNKQFTYLLAGLPTVMSDTPAHKKFAEGLEPAVTLYQAGNSNSLAAALDKLLMSEATFEEARKMAFNLGQERFNWDTEKSKLLNTVRQAFETKVNPAAR